MITEIVSSNRIVPFLPIKLGSSSTDSEDSDFVTDYFVAQSPYSAGYYPSFDVASHLASVSPISENETYKHKKLIPEKMLEHDIFVKMPPKKRRTVKFQIRHVRRAKPRIVIPENPYIDI
jgi:hypothetical protein